MTGPAMVDTGGAKEIQSTGTGGCSSVPPHL